MTKKINIPKDNNIIKVPLEEAMPDNYLPYAVEVAKDRALPDVRDGLKPVHRRILYGAYMLKAFPDKPYYKSARIVGDILGKYHPHGDASVYDSMVILAQDFTTRMPLIDGHGNWGSQDGDSAAAMRYTEARLTPIALEMLKDIDKDVVDMMDNYSGSELEPVVLPAKYPNLLVNGVFGIAVGLATNIPPHNLNEVIDGTLEYIDNPEITTKELMNYIKGPDLPTGGILIGKNALLAAYETGEGKVTLRSKTKIEKLENGRLAIVISEFTFRRNKAKLLQLISEMTGDKKHSKALEAITDIRDESDRNGIRGVIELRKSATEETADKVLKYLFKKTELQCNVSFNMVAIANGKPETMGLKTILNYYVEHQKEVITRRTKKELEIAERRFHIVEGFIKAIDIIDEIIAVIRASKSKKDSETNIMSKFGFSEIQAEAIVELMLYRLTGLEIKTFEKEYKELQKFISALKKILESEKELKNVIKKQLKGIKENYGDARRTLIVDNDDEAKIDIEELIVVEDTMVTMSNEGFIKMVPLKSYNRSNTNEEDIEYREGDFNKFTFQSNTTDIVMFFTDLGNMYRLKGSQVPEYKWKEKGEKLDSIIKGLDFNKEKIVSVFSVSSMILQKEFIFITDKGNIKKSSLNRFDSAYTKIMALKLKNDEKLLNVRLTDVEIERQYITVKTLSGLSFSVEEIDMPEADRMVSGTSLFNLSSNDRIISVDFSKIYEFKSFNIGFSRDGFINIYESPKSSSLEECVCVTNSMCRLLIFLNDGRVLNIPSFMFENIKESINIKSIIDDFEEGKTRIVGAVSLVDFNEDMSIYFISRKGLIKRTLLSEFSADSFTATGYKIKSSDDNLVRVIFIDNNEKKELLFITRRAMCIRFSPASINYMGKVASGVTGISLSEDDEVIFASLVEGENEHIRNSKITLISKKSGRCEVKLWNIKTQNRAGRGKSLMLIVLDDFIKEVRIL